MAKSLRLINRRVVVARASGVGRSVRESYDYRNAEHSCVDRSPREWVREILKNSLHFSGSIARPFSGVSESIAQFLESIVQGQVRKDSSVSPTDIRRSLYGSQTSQAVAWRAKSNILQKAGTKLCNLPSLFRKTCNLT
ncbi:hypothetical protein [Paraburkholderia ribeironis]|nr:hypothetical protein [Paraburkholderia ribeironis]